jgi:hypothetical protein
MPEAGAKGGGAGGEFHRRFAMVDVLNRLFRMRRKALPEISLVYVYLEPDSTIVDSIGYTQGISYLFKDEHFVTKLICSYTLIGGGHICVMLGDVHFHLWTENEQAIMETRGALREAGIQVPITAQFKFLTQCTEPVQMLKN